MEPVNSSYDADLVIKAIDKALGSFYTKLTNKLNTINLLTILKRKNPYLYRAKGVQSATEIVQQILAAFVSSSEETLFGQEFFEPIAVAVSGGQKAMTEGADITIDRPDGIYTVAVKSGTSVFNADSRKRQYQNFNSAMKRAQQAKKAFFPIVGYGYGRKRARYTVDFIELAGQDFWEWLTGDELFYLKIIGYMGSKPDEYAKVFFEAYNKAENRLLAEFTQKFCCQDGSIDWAMLVTFNSGRT